MKSLVVLLTLFATGAFGQGVTGSITGVVTDPSASVVADAKITVKNTLTGVSATTATNAAGIYNLPSLTAGAYEITVESPGFKTNVGTNLVLDAGRALRVDVTLQVGALGESVTVRQGFRQI